MGIIQLTSLRIFGYISCDSFVVALIIGLKQLIEWFQKTIGIHDWGKAYFGPQLGGTQLPKSANLGYKSQGIWQVSRLALIPLSRKQRPRASKKDNGFELEGENLCILIFLLSQGKTTLVLKLKVQLFVFKATL